MSDDARYDALVTVLENDPDLDVTARADGLYVHDRRFAYLREEGLAVRLPRDRAKDLIERSIATPRDVDEPTAPGRWVVIADAEDWMELAGEAHTLAHGHVPGKGS